MIKAPSNHCYICGTKTKNLREWLRAWNGICPKCKKKTGLPPWLLVIFLINMLAMVLYIACLFYWMGNTYPFILKVTALLEMMVAFWVVFYFFASSNKRHFLQGWFIDNIKMRSENGHDEETKKDHKKMIKSLNRNLRVYHIAVCALSFMIIVSLFTIKQVDVYYFQRSDRDPNNVELFIEEDSALTSAVYALGRDTSELDAHIVSMINDCTDDNQTFIVSYYLEMVEEFVDNITYRSGTGYRPVDVTYEKMEGNCAAKSIIEAYMCNLVEIPNTLLSFNTVDEHGIRGPGHMECFPDYTLQDFVNDFDYLVEFYNAYYFDNDNCRIDYVVLYDMI